MGYLSASCVGWRYWVSTSAKEEEEIAEQLPLVGPLLMAIDATTAELQSYTGGVYDPPACTGWHGVLDHAVLAVGIGTEGGVPYYKVKNSWGADWGEAGYFRIKRGANLCGVAMEVLHSTFNSSRVS